MYFVGLKKIPSLDETPTVQVAKIVPTNCFDFFKMQVMAISLVPQAEGSLGSRIFIFLEGFKRQGSVTSQYLFVLGHPWWMKKKYKTEGKGSWGYPTDFQYPNWCGIIIAVVATFFAFGLGSSSEVCAMGNGVITSIRPDDQTHASVQFSLCWNFGAKRDRLAEIFAYYLATQCVVCRSRTTGCVLNV